MPFPPTYDWDETTTAIDPPTSIELQGTPVSRQMCSFHVGIPVLVLRTELEALLPKGFTPIQDPNNPATLHSFVGLAFGVHTRLVRNDKTFGPYLNFLASTPAINTNRSPPRLEYVVLGSYISDTAACDALNVANGQNTSRVPLSSKTEIEEASGYFEYKITIDLPGPIVKLWGNYSYLTKCRLQASAKVPLASIKDRIILAPGYTPPSGSPPPGPLRSTDKTTAGNARWSAQQGDGASLTPAAANAKIDLFSSSGKGLGFFFPSTKLILPGGTLDIVGLNTQANARVFVRNNLEILAYDAP